MAGGALQRQTSYLKAAFLNAYNLVLLGGTSLAALTTHDFWIAGAGLALEGLWMTLAPSSRRFQRAIDARTASELRHEHLREMQEQAALLPSEERQRVQLLGTRAAEVKAECLRNPRLQGEFMAAQLERLDGLVAEFIHLAITAHRCDSYLNRADTRQISRERDTWRRTAETATDKAARELALQNVAILDKRVLLVEELVRFVERARGQMALIQNTVALLRDQVMTMVTPEAITLQLDELVTSVEAIREALREVESVVSSQSVRPLSPTDAVSPEPDLADRSPGGANRVRS